MFFEKDVKEMKEIIVLLLMVMFLTGCTGMEIGWFDLNNFVLPDDDEFLSSIKWLDSVLWIAWYMQSNFSYQYCVYAKSPYQLWKTKIGDCNDFSLFGAVAGAYNGLNTWQIRITFDDSNISHWLAIYKAENEDFYSYTTNQYYGGSFQSEEDFEAFEVIVNSYCSSRKRKWISYRVYNCNGDIIKEEVQH
ncbi:MAG TPA: hypothetical protein VFD40_00575 [Candidatus Paceibacterota bacterium]|nr:hypothetical protein [Candidatus Paceibacterota bacterium]